ncbi:MAG TPA: diguanylate cyclase [Gaiellaceae bacterium]|nr:diguanylate cyclase [Gaiellaceae bacterium]
MGELASTQPAVSAAEVAEAAHASDLFVFRRVAEQRFAHVGGFGRGAGWAGINEVDDDDPKLGRLLASANPIVRSSHDAPFHVIGPYYAKQVALARLSHDVFVVFGGPDEAMAEVTDSEFLELSQFASDALVEVAPAKRLADEVEALNAVRDLLHAPAETFAQAAQHLVEQATSSLSCDLGLLYFEEGERVFICERGESAALEITDMAVVLAQIAARGVFPLCIQEAAANELPAPFRSADGVLAYYLLEVERPLAGVLLLLHTAAAPARGFTLLCQSLGKRLVEAAEPLLSSALLRDALTEDLQLAATQARRDVLTGLANRLAWSEAVEDATASKDAPLSILLADCCGLKSINDSYSHRVGDEQLCRIAAVLRASARSQDLVARLGGDEFGVLLVDADEGTAEDVLARIRAAAAKDTRPARPELRLAIGSATTRGERVEAAQHEADERLVDAKRQLRCADSG